MDEQPQVWRSGRRIVMRRDAVLPDRCIKMNNPASVSRIKKKYSWYHPAFNLLCLLFLFGIGGLLPLTLIMCALSGASKKVVLQIPVSGEYLARRIRAIMGACILMSLAAPLFVVGVRVADKNPGTFSLLLVLAGPVLFVAALNWAVVRARIVSVRRIRGDRVWLAGAHPDYVAALPEWSAQPVKESPVEALAGR